MPAEVMEILGKLLVLANSDGGQAVLAKFFVDHGVTREAVTKAIAALPPVKDTKEV